MKKDGLSPDECQQLEALGFRPMMPPFDYFRGKEEVFENMIVRSKITAGWDGLKYSAFQGVCVYLISGCVCIASKIRKKRFKTFDELVSWLGFPASD